MLVYAVTITYLQSLSVCIYIVIINYNLLRFNIHLLKLQHLEGTQSGVFGVEPLSLFVHTTYLKEFLTVATVPIMTVYTLTGQITLHSCLVALTVLFQTETLLTGTNQQSLVQMYLLK